MHRRKPNKPKKPMKFESPIVTATENLPFSCLMNGKNNGLDLSPSLLRHFEVPTCWDPYKEKKAIQTYILNVQTVEIVSCFQTFCFPELAFFLFVFGAEITAYISRGIMVIPKASVLLYIIILWMSQKLYQ